MCSAWISLSGAGSTLLRSSHSRRCVIAMPGEADIKHVDASAVLQPVKIPISSDLWTRFPSQRLHVWTSPDTFVVGQQIEERLSNLLPCERLDVLQAVQQRADGVVLSLSVHRPHPVTPRQLAFSEEVQDVPVDGKTWRQPRFSFLNTQQNTGRDVRSILIIDQLLHLAEADVTADVTKAQRSSL